MSIETVAILSPGDMGHAVGALLREHELRVVTCLDGRSGRTQVLSDKAGIIDVPDLDEMVRQSDVVLSITVSEVVPSLCQRMAGAIRSTGSTTLFAECNAIAPNLAREMESLIVGAGGRFVDASIIGHPPREGSSPRFYTSGPHASEFAELREFGLDVRPIGPDTGRASGIKMCYAAMNKGSLALYTQLLMAAEMMGLSDDLLSEFRASQPAERQKMETVVPGLPAKSRRWVSEMQQIEATFEDLGLTPFIFRGVADMCRLMGGTPLGLETPETKDTARTLQQTIEQLVASPQLETQ